MILLRGVQKIGRRSNMIAKIISILTKNKERLEMNMQHWVMERFADMYNNLAVWRREDWFKHTRCVSLQIQ